MSSGVDITLNLQENEQMIAGFAGGAFGLFFQLFLFWVGFQLVGRITGTSGNGPNNPFNMLKSNVEMVENVEENFESVAGADEAKEELVEIVDFLKIHRRQSKVCIMLFESYLKRKSLMVERHQYAG